MGDIARRGGPGLRLGVFRVKKNNDFNRCDFCPGTPPYSHLLVIHGKENTPPIVLCPVCELDLSTRLFKDYLEFRGLKEAGGSITLFVPEGVKDGN